MLSKTILKSACDKLYASINREIKKSLPTAFLDDAEWMIECACINAEEGYEASSLKRLNRCARDYVEEYSTIGAEYCDLIGAIGYAQCTEDIDYEQNKWNALKEWAKNK